MCIIQVILMVLVISIPVITYAQSISQPPSSGDEFAWMRWIIIILTGGLAAAFGFINKIYENALKGKDKQIQDLKKTIIDLNEDKDNLQKDIMNKVIPAVISSNELIKTFLNRNV